MERVLKKTKLSDMRRLLRTCFGNLPYASRVPLEIWRDTIVLEMMDIQTMTVLAQTCRGFWELIEEIRRRNVGIALRYRTCDQIPLARRCLKMCARSGVAEAMFHLGCAKRWGGFGVRSNPENVEWIQKAAEHGSYAAMVVYVDYLIKQETTIDLSYWTEKILSCGDNLALGLYYNDIENDYKKAEPFLKKSAQEGNAYAQHQLGVLYWYEYYSPNKHMTGTYWIQRAAGQGHFEAQMQLSCFSGAPDDDSEKTYWRKKMIKQLK